jgi:hypothetical protein
VVKQDVLSSKETVFLKCSLMILHHTWYLSRRRRLQEPWVWLSTPDHISDWIFLKPKWPRQ